MANVNRRSWLKQSLLASSTLLIPHHPMVASVFQQPSFSGDTLLLASNENPYGPPESARKAIIESLSEANRYPFSVYEELTNSIAEKYELSADQLFLTSGSTEALSLLGQHVGLKKGEVLIPHPSFPTLSMFAERCGASIRKVEMNSDTIDLEQLLEAIAEETTLVYICNPNNPTSTEVDAKELKSFCRKVPENVLICIDEAYIQYSRQGEKGSMVSLVAELPNLIICRTFSKVYGLAGMRLGYAISNVENIRALRERVPGWGMSVSAASVVGAKAALNDSEFLTKCINKNEEGRQIVYKTFDDWNISYSRSATNFIYTTAIDKFQKDFIEKLLAEKIEVSQWGFLDHDYVRISISTPEEMQAFTARLEKYLV